MPMDTNGKCVSFDANRDCIPCDQKESDQKNLNSFCTMSILSPFFTVVCHKKGIPEYTAGLVMSSYPLTMFLSSPLFGKIVPRFGPKFIYVSGVATAGLCNIILAFADRFENSSYFIAASFIIRAIDALGISAYVTSAFVLVIGQFPENAGAVRGLLETFVGLGLCTGPAIGGFLFTAGGFELPFFVMGTALLLMAFLNLQFMSPSNLEGKDLERGGSLISLIKFPSILITCMVIMCSSMNITFMEPILEPHLRKFNFDPSQVGLVFFVFCVSYGIFSPISGWLTDKLENYTWLMIGGLFFSSISLLFLGPSPLFNFLEDAVWLNVVVLFFLGMFVATSVIPTYQLILDCAKACDGNECMPELKEICQICDKGKGYKVASKYCRDIRGGCGYYTFKTCCFSCYQEYCGDYKIAYYEALKEAVENQIRNPYPSKNPFKKSK